MLFGRDIYDGKWRLFDYDPLTGRTVWVLYEDDRTHFRTDYPVENLIRDNKLLQTETAGKRFTDMTLVASIPINIYQDSGFEKAQREGDNAFMKRFLNDGDNAAWRTKEGHL